jgi:hypothetical protein
MTATVYTISLSHHSLGRSEEYKCDDLPGAMDIGDDKFGDGFVGHKIIITDCLGVTIASKTIGDDYGWDCDDEM